MAESKFQQIKDKHHTLMEQSKNEAHERKKSFMEITNAYLLSDSQRLQKRGKKRLTWRFFADNVWYFVKWAILDLIALLPIYMAWDNGQSIIHNSLLLKTMTGKLQYAIFEQTMLNAGVIAGVTAACGFAIVLHGWPKWPHRFKSVNAYIDNLTPDIKQEHYLSVVKSLLNEPLRPKMNRKSQLRQDLVHRYGPAKGMTIYEEYAPQINRQGHFKVTQNKSR